MRLGGKVAVVTGAGGGIGEAICRLFSAEGAGTFRGCQAAISRMRPRGRGIIVNMSSESGKVGNSRCAAYCGSKFGIIGLTQSLAVEFARDGIRVNALCPGVVLTPLWDGQISDYAAKYGISTEDAPSYIAGIIPVGRLAEAEE